MGTAAEWPKALLLIEEIHKTEKIPAWAILKKTIMKPKESILNISKGQMGTQTANCCCTRRGNSLKILKAFNGETLKSFKDPHISKKTPI